MSFQLGPRTPQWSAKQKLYSRRPEHGERRPLSSLCVYMQCSYIKVRSYKHGATTAVSIRPCNIVITRFVLPAPMTFVEDYELLLWSDLMKFNGDDKIKMRRLELRSHAHRYKFNR